MGVLSSPWARHARSAALSAVALSILALLYLRSHDRYNIIQKDRSQHPLLDPTVTTSFGLTPGHNPILPNERAVQGPWVAHLPAYVKTNQEFTTTLTCTYAAEEGWCPSSYILWFRGLTSLVVPHDPHHICVLDSQNKTVGITYAIKDPGVYEVWAWPEYEDCERFKEMKYPLSNALVQGTPYKITVEGAAPEEGYGVCVEDAPEGRWVSTEHTDRSHKSDAWARSYQNSHGHWRNAFIYQPYSCKRAATSPATLDDPSLSDVKHVLYIGDLTTRGPYCAHTYPMFHDGKIDGPCAYTHDYEFWKEYQMQLTRSFTCRTPKGKDTAWSLLFQGEPGRPAYHVQALERLLEHPLGPPSHVVVNFGLWQAAKTELEYATSVDEMLAFIHHYLPNAHITWRLTTSIFRPAGCYDYNHLARPMTRMQSHVGREMVKTWRKKGMRIVVVDGNGLTDSRPDTSADGRHWVV
ncbi:hypothetical protein SAICODRAFT_29883 [Saitoella complicata NRRL Y-17804]|uniref:Uncharacterized protein n=1 Tax=Saitoella complicata (strain BCRC 22490 / CBS 7301 / JCM 7358 / NBRC 10748 / NRRL Y-17804) TaxID=698492 RepID=A0A0E9NAD1_SAICN|nr:uncharacterized protein SAICODRAFT_29883 [Saitoella complicata NRRL Y-17804]ODQ53943.1 hypothetical protein SAICODRAFT_29883 [Saitoella complicata NRRL Y-17804]GAO46842.1 hypothetical protein G7K_1060-t1 [Saitoella complicata NRRL Y-17804]